MVFRLIRRMQLRLRFANQLIHRQTQQLPGFAIGLDDQSRVGVSGNDGVVGGFHQTAEASVRPSTWTRCPV